LLGAGGGVADAADTYANGQLTIPSIIIGNAEYTNVVVTVAGIVVVPTTNLAFGPELVGDVWNPATGELYVASVNVGDVTYENAVVRIGSLVSIGAVTGGGVYAGGSVLLPVVQLLGGPVFTGVQVAVSPQDIRGIAGGMPQVSQNTYDPATHLLTLPVAEYNGRVFTNVTAAVAVNQVQQVSGGPQLRDSILYSFAGGSDGAEPFVTVVQGTDGNFYGTTYYGGVGGQATPGNPSGQGTVFKLTPSGQKTILHTFQGGTTDGANPYAPLVEWQGNFYGTTTAGGTADAGTVFEVTPQGQETVLYSFTGGNSVSQDGVSPYGLVLASDGNFYGTTNIGGATGNGMVFRITPAGVETPLYSFKGGNADGAYPLSGLVQGTDGLLYGTTTGGGSAGGGTVFSLSLTGSETLLHVFGATTNPGDGFLPYANLIQASDGNFYGTTYYGGHYNTGTVFRYDPRSGTESVLYSFSGGGGSPGSSDGAYPYGGVIQATDGNLYGAANNGGAYNVGTVYRVTLAGQETTLYSFSGISFTDGHSSSILDGANPNAVIQGADGNLYGTAYLGGPASYGDVFKLAGAVR
jgi:uncharacterized repeat protein (TIGR03803 family)